MAPLGGVFYTPFQAPGGGGDNFRGGCRVCGGTLYCSALKQPLLGWLGKKYPAQVHLGSLYSWPFRAACKPPRTRSHPSHSVTTPSHSRKPLIAGNWKMNLDRKSIQALVSAVSAGIVGRGDVDVAFFPPSVYLPEVLKACEGTRIMVGAQNVSEQAAGAYTGEISVSMLKDVAVPCVLIGHSERRHVYGETLDQIHAKVAIALEAGLQVVLCIGETLEEREAGRTEAVCAEQLSTALAGVSRADLIHITLAYEPVWAIGTGVVATPEQAAAVHQYVRGVLAGLFDDSGAQSTRILYGGSVKADNVSELMSVPDIDGALVGGASLAAKSFLPIIEGALG